MRNEEFKITVGDVVLKGNLIVPPKAKGIVIFAHGSGSSRFSPREVYVAEVLQKAGFITLIMDLLTEREEMDRANVFDINLLSHRLRDTTKSIIKDEEKKQLPIGYFGASTGAAAALHAAAELADIVRAVVSRGGRPDLALQYLPKIKAPTLLIVGGDDVQVIGMNKKALKYLDIEKKLEIIPGATHLFEEPGKLDEVAKLATGWFIKHLKGKKK